MVLGVLALPVLALWRQPPQERQPLVVIVIAACAVRLITALALHATGAWQVTGRGAITPDEATVDLAARLLAAGDDRSPLVLGGSLHTSWVIVSWSVYDLLWNSLLAMKVLNVLLGTALVVPVYLLARQLHSVRSATLAAWLTAAFPPAIVWSALALRESMLALILTTLLLLAVTPLSTRRSAQAGWVCLAAASLVVLCFTRSYMVPLLMLVILAAALVGGSRARRLRQTTAAVAAVLFALAAVLVLPTGAQTARATVALVAEPAGIYNPLSDCQQAGTGGAVADPRSAGASAYKLRGAELKTSAEAEDDDLSASLQSVGQKGVARAFAIAILAGRPVWRTQEFFFLLQPGVVLWWALLPTMMLGSFMIARRRRWDGLVATAGYAVAVIVFLAYSGQFIRHHYMLEPVGLVLAAVGICDVRERVPSDRVRRGAIAATAAMSAAALASVVASLMP
jgi:4-amino-4-deoxy-L-arabinose transferase-like glycosyltransferase